MTESDSAKRSSSDKPDDSDDTSNQDVVVEVTSTSGGSTAVRLKSEAPPTSEPNPPVSVRVATAERMAPPTRLEQAKTVDLTDKVELAQASHPDEWPDSGPAAESSWARALVGSVLEGRYRVEGVIGEGAMGVVYRARHQIIDKVVAIKVLRKDLASEAEVTDRFMIEAKAASAIGSPHIIDTLDFGSLPDGSTYSVMEYLEGRTLSSLMGQETLSVERILRIGKQIAEGLEDAHEAGIIHRDLKPDNVFITRRGRDREFVKVLDFGIAKVASAQNKLTRAGAVFGTPHYMSPEQASGQAVDRRTDIYSLGAMLYEMAAGRVPFDAEGPMAILHMHIHTEPTPPSELPEITRPISDSLEAIILKCMQKDPQHRYRTMAEVAIELDKASGGMTPDAVREIAWRVSRRGQGLKRAATRRPLIAAVSLIVVASGAGAAAYANRLAAPAPEIEGRAIRSVPGLASAVEFIEKMDHESSEPAPLRGGYREVAIIVSPIDAEVTHDGKDLGVMPITVKVKEGETIPISVWKRGFHRKNVTVDGSRAREVIRLVTLAMAKPEPRQPSDASSAAAKPPESIPEVDPKKAAPPASTAAPSDKPADSKPADSKATDSKPTESKPAETKPGSIPAASGTPRSDAPPASSGEAPKAPPPETGE